MSPGGSGIESFGADTTGAPWFVDIGGRLEEMILVLLLWWIFNESPLTYSVTVFLDSSSSSSESSSPFFSSSSSIF